MCVFLNLQIASKQQQQQQQHYHQTKRSTNKIYEQKNIIYDSLLCCCSTNNTEKEKKEILHHCTNKQNTNIVYISKAFEFASDIYGLCVLNTPEPLHDKCLCIHYIDSHKFIIKIKNTPTKL